MNPIEAELRAKIEEVEKNMHDLVLVHQHLYSSLARFQKGEVTEENIPSIRAEHEALIAQAQTKLEQFNLNAGTAEAVK